MKWILQTGIGLAACTLLIGVLLSGASRAQSARQALPGNDGQVAIVHSVRGVAGPDGPAVEILSSLPIVPTIRTVENPPRLVIDLPYTRLATNKKRITFRTTETESLRVDQFQEYPPIARIVVDLLQPVTYSLDASGNRVMIRLHTDGSAAKPASVPAVAPTAQPVAVPVRSAATEDATLDGNRVDAGSSVTAGSDAAVVQLGRGGQVRVCPGTTVSVTPSKNGRSLMLGMNTGAMEAHYTLGPSADSIITPDFRIQLVGPGEFDFAINADSRGNTCVQALPGNTASVIVSELLGDGTYQVKPTDQVVFHSGQLKNVAMAGSNSCGCPAPERPVMLASSAAPASAVKSQPADSTQALPQVLPSPGSESAALPPSNPKDVHVQVDAPFVFRGDDPAPAPPMVEVQVLPLRSPSAAEPVEATVLAPAPKEHHGFFGKLRGFFAAIFS